MRPISGGDALSPVKPPSRKSSVDRPAAPSSHIPTSFVFRSGEDLELLDAPHSAPAARKQRDSTFGVQSLEDTLEAAFGTESVAAAGQRAAKATKTRKHGAKSSTSQPGSASADPVALPDSSKDTRAHRLESAFPDHVSPSFFAPKNADVLSSHPTSALPSTPRSASIHSLKLSDEDSAMEDAASQAIASSGDEEEHAEMEQAPSGFPQLVMPSIQIPTRRPFTTRGKAMGKLKMMVAGETGIGKSSLIRSILQVCEDIVHVDPLSPSQSYSHTRPPKSKSRTRRVENACSNRVTETYASTKPYPRWWTDAEDSRVSRRRKSSMDTVLERNICFVDTPGYSRGSSEKDDMSMVVDYVESLLYQTSSVTTLEDNDALGVVSGSGGVLVDVVIYLLPPTRDIAPDIEYMQRLSCLTNVIPIIAKSDTLSAQEAIALKTSILARLQTTAFRPFLFGNAMDDALLAVQSLPMASTSASRVPSEVPEYPFSTPTHPFAVSSHSGPDNDNMDASLLMSSDYVQPLLPSELVALVNQVFDPESIAWLRHSAAKKYLAWRRRTRLPDDSAIMQGLSRPHTPTTMSVGLNGAAIYTSAASSLFSAASPSGVLVPGSGSPFYSNLQSPLLASSPSVANSEPSGNFSLARYNNSAQGDQRLSDIRIAKWATDLQRSRRNERERLEELQSNERARWLLERVGEEGSKGIIVASPGDSPRAEWAVIRHVGEKKTSRIGQRYGKVVGLDSRDPLGLCELGDDLRRKGFVLVKVLGGMSVLGAVVVAFVRACGMETGLSQEGWWGWLSGTE